MYKVNQDVIANRQNVVGKFLDSILTEGLYFTALVLFGYLVMILIEG